jgi:hypothetical protein
MADHSVPTTTSNLAAVLANIDARIDDMLFRLDPAVTTATNVPANTIRWTSASSKFQKWNGATWSDLAPTYAITAADVAGTSDTYSPVISFATNGNLAVNYATQEGYYTRIGPLVFVSIALSTSVFTHSTASGAFQVSLPIAAASGNDSFLTVGFHSSAFDYTGTAVRGLLVGAIAEGSSVATLRQHGDALNTSALTTSNVGSGSTVTLAMSGVYRV